MTLGSTQPQTKMSARNLPGGKGRPARKTDLTTICEPIVWKNVGASTSPNPMGLHRLLQIYLFYFFTKPRTTFCGQNAQCNKAGNTVALVRHLMYYILWDGSFCSPLKVNRRFCGTYRHHLP
jgi:hypothetical protein